MKMNGKYTISLFIISIITMLIVFGCGRERVSHRTPIHPNPNMDRQEKYKAQSESNFFENGAAMRLLVEGTVSRGWLKDNVAFFTGKDIKGIYINRAPVEANLDRIKRGQERFNIFCSPCHSKIGDGQSIMVKKEYVPLPNFHSDSVRNFSDGYLFDVITNGVRNMPSYKHQIPTDDRWSIILYLRALQRSHNASESDVPAEIREKLK